MSQRYIKTFEAGVLSDLCCLNYLNWPTECDIEHTL